MLLPTNYNRVAEHNASVCDDHGFHVTCSNVSSNLYKVQLCWVLPLVESRRQRPWGTRQAQHQAWSWKTPTPLCQPTPPSTDWVVCWSSQVPWTEKERHSLREWSVILTVKTHTGTAACTELCSIIVNQWSQSSDKKHNLTYLFKYSQHSILNTHIII